jgi:hypothetical protein
MGFITDVKEMSLCLGEHFTKEFIQRYNADNNTNCIVTVVDSVGEIYTTVAIKYTVELTHDLMHMNNDPMYQILTIFFTNIIEKMGVTEFYIESKSSTQFVQDKDSFQPYMLIFTKVSTL